MSVDLTSVAEQGGASFRSGVWEAVLELLAQADVRVLFGLPADDLRLLRAIRDLAGSSGREKPPRLVLCRDQRNAVFMATGYAIASGRAGVAVVGKGPALTNALTGLLEASYSAAPVVLLAAGTSAQARGSGAFQELDQLALAQPLVKHAQRVDHPDRVAPALHQALLIAAHGCPGPVYLELPDHLLEVPVRIPAGGPGGIDSPFETCVSDPDSAALRTLLAAQRPMILVGGGMRHRNHDHAVEQLADQIGAALCCTASGRGVLDEDHPQFVGLSGLYAPTSAAALWAETDCVLTLGSRLEETAVFGWPPTIGVTVPVIQVNIDVAGLRVEFGGHRLVEEAGRVVRAWSASSRAADPGRSSWSARVRVARQRIVTSVVADLADRHPTVADVLATIQRVLPDDRILVQENGLADMWSYHFPVYSCGRHGGSVVPSEQTSLGFGAAAAAGVKLAAGDRAVVALVGDGAFDLFSSDLPTMADERLGVLYVVLRNGGYGWLQSQLDQHVPDSPFSFVRPERMASAIAPMRGVHQVTVLDRDELERELRGAWQRCRRGAVAVVNVPITLADAPLATTPLAGDFPSVECPQPTNER